jgi:hypothetical protein
MIVLGVEIQSIGIYVGYARARRRSREIRLDPRPPIVTLPSQFQGSPG